MTSWCSCVARELAAREVSPSRPQRFPEGGFVLIRLAEGVIAIVTPSGGVIEDVLPNAVQIVVGADDVLVVVPLSEAGAWGTKVGIEASG